MAKTVLVIDESPTMRTLLRLALARAGHEVIEASDGEAASRLLDGRPLGLVVCDNTLPRNHDTGFLHSLRQHPRYRATPLVLLSTDTRPQHRAAARAAGAQAFITKPWHPQDLLSAVQRLCP